MALSTVPKFAREPTLPGRLNPYQKSYPQIRVVYDRMVPVGKAHPPWQVDSDQGWILEEKRRTVLGGNYPGLTGEDGTGDYSDPTAFVAAQYGPTRDIDGRLDRWTVRCHLKEGELMMITQTWPFEPPKNLKHL